MPFEGPMEWSLFGWLLAGALSLLGIGLTSTGTGIVTAWRMRGALDKRDQEQAAALQQVKQESDDGIQSVRDESRAALQTAKDLWANELRAMVTEVRNMKEQLVEQITQSRHELRGEVSGRALASENKLEALTRSVTEINVRTLATDQKVDALTATVADHVREDRDLFQNHGERLAKLEPAGPLWQGPQKNPANKRR